MKTRKEKNINIFNKDIKKNAGYIYTDDTCFSAKIATTKQTNELVSFAKKYFEKNIRILDIGCGDGKFTIEFFKNFSPISITGIDPAQQAIKIAKSRIEKNYKKKIIFKVGNIYDLNKLFKKDQYDLVIIRGVLHHLYRPKLAINKIGKLFPAVIILEANGYNPILKVMEKVSSYHREHEEKSYWPPSLNNWFKKEGYKVITERYYGIVPYFCPDFIARFLKYIEPFFENIPYLNRLYCACNYILYRKYD